jgi:heme-degrading monooxygenase HmoA
MEHVRVATYRLMGDAAFTEIADAAKGGMLDTFRMEPGFLRYEVADLGEGQLISISLWESRDAAERGTAAAREWVGQHLAGRIELVSNQIGDLAFTATK